MQDYIRRFGKRRVEADALVTRPQAGRDLCERAILEYINPDGIARYERGRQEKRQEMRQALDQLLSAL